MTETPTNYAEKYAKAAEAAFDEVKGKSRIFVWTYTVEPPNPDEAPEKRVLELTIPRKFKRFKFARKAGAGDFVGALEVVFGAEALEPLEDLDMDQEEWEDFMNRLGEAIAGTGNS
jgi:hypothetical protein